MSPRQATVLGLLALAACSAPASSSDDAGAPCTSPAQCNDGQVCAFPAADRCFGLGTCMALHPVCNAIVLGCACDGSKINIACTDLPAGYFSKPVRDPSASCP